MSLTFGVYPGGLSATADGAITPGPAEDPVRIAAALDDLHGDRPFLVRGYVHYSDAAPGLVEGPPNVARYATGTRRLDLVLCFREPGEDLTGWLRFVREQVRRHAPYLASIQITEEPDNAGPGGDGGFPAVRQALIEGVVAAREEVAHYRTAHYRTAQDEGAQDEGAQDEAARHGLMRDEVGRHGLTRDEGGRYGVGLYGAAREEAGAGILVGCNSTLDFDPGQGYWTGLGAVGGDRFRSALGYVGLDFFPDVFAPVPAGSLRATVGGVLRFFRERSLAAAGIDQGVPIHVTEHGWPTGPGRSESRQAEVLATVVDTVAELSSELNITTYQHFGLRDADSGVDDPMFRFGLMTSDYRPKPAFGVFRELITRTPSGS